MRFSAAFTDAAVTASAHATASVCVYDIESDKALADVITLYDEKIPEGEGVEYEIFDPNAVWKRKTLTNYYVRELQVPVFEKGGKVYESPDIQTIKKFCQDQIETLWEETLRFENPQDYYVDLSQKLWDIKHELIDTLSKK